MSAFSKAISTVRETKGKVLHDKEKQSVISNPFSASDPPINFKENKAIK